MQPQLTRFGILLALSAGALTLSACIDSDNDNGSDDGVEVTRDHDSREFQVAADLSFDAMDGATAYWGTYEGLQGEAGYTVEVPDGWDGDGLIMWTRGYGGEGEELGKVVPNAAFRQSVLGAGYAWAASTYSANFYDVRAAVEDTNKLALELTDYLLNDHDTYYNEPQQRLVAGVSMGGHTAAALVERETIDTARHSVEYGGAMPLCQAEQNQFQWLGDYPRVAQQLAGLGNEPYEDFQDNLPAIIGALFELDSEGNPTWEPANQQGERLEEVAMRLTGGERPIFEHGFRSVYQSIVFGTGGRDGTINGILARNIYDNTDRTYRWTDGDITAEEQTFNDDIERVAADKDVNPLRSDGVRWLPLVKGEFDVPVLTMHTLGDFYVPFRHQQLYRKRAEDNGNGDLLVQRAIRAPGHCDFSGPEIATATTQFLQWVNDGPKPAGDNVTDAETVADDEFGCAHTEPDRAGLEACQD